MDKRTKNKKYATYTEHQVAAMIQVADSIEEALVRFLVGTGLHIGEATVAEWMDINWEDKTISVRFKPKFGFKPNDYEERTIAVSDTLLACLKKYRRNAADDALIFPSPATKTVDKHLRFSRVVCHTPAPARRLHRNLAAGTWAFRHHNDTNLLTVGEYKVRRTPRPNQ